MQDLSYPMGGPIFQVGEYSFSVHIYTYENVYEPDPGRVSIHKEGHSLIIEASGLVWAGGQESAPGSITVHVDELATKSEFSIRASAERVIRRVKLVFHDLPEMNLVNLRESPSTEIPAEGLYIKYPQGWYQISTPLILGSLGDKRYLYARSLDKQVREKHFVFQKVHTTTRMELIFEDDTPSQGTTVEVPPWEVGFVTEVEQVYADQKEYVQKTHGLVKWEQRADIPQWMREISLVAAIHMQHWSGYVFNTYHEALEKLKVLSGKIDGKRILAYLPGWEGRYYFDYGTYVPDPRMGGEEGFKQLIEEAHALGIRVMPMFGINMASRSTPNFEVWGESSLLRTAGGAAFSGSVDWDGSRHFNHEYLANCNPAAPGWQNHLVGRIRESIDRYGYDAVFLDISALWSNDPNFHVYRGIRNMVERIKHGHPELLVSGEGWYDALGLATPLVQSGHIKGELNWHDTPYEPMFSDFNRSFAHLCLGDPKTNSTGVHELGFTRFERSPLRKGIIPTLTLIGDSLEAVENVDQVIKDAHTYAERFIEHPASV